MNSKKGTLDIMFRWPEYVAILFIIIGIILALSTGSAMMNYIVAFVCGLFFGRLWYAKRKDIKMPWFIVIFAFLIGFVIGSIYGDVKVVILSFLLGCVVSYYIHSKHIISTRGTH